MSRGIALLVLVLVLPVGAVAVLMGLATMVLLARFCGRRLRRRF